MAEQMHIYSKSGFALSQSHLSSFQINEKKIELQSPSNIALVKYWGKKDNQLPLNPSISFTLAHSKTECSLQVDTKKDSSKIVDCDFFFEGQLAESIFSARVNKFLLEVAPIFPFIRDLKLRFLTRNTFPHSTGIASSASSMSAISLALCYLEKFLFGSKMKISEEEFLKKASYVSRLGSGSACRSIYGGAVIWGDEKNEDEKADYFARQLLEVNSIFKTYQDAILIVSSAKKEISSTQGHQLMKSHPFATARIKMAQENTRKMVKILSSGDLENFAMVVEQEALTLHGLMLSSSPSFCLLHPNSLIIIEKIKAFKKATGHPLTFTLDAGPNIHLLYPQHIQSSVVNFINEELLPYLEDKKVIFDSVGTGPSEINYAN